MAKKAKLIERILSGRSDSNIAFSELVGLLESLGFDHRQAGAIIYSQNQGSEIGLISKPTGRKQRVIRCGRSVKFLQSMSSTKTNEFRYGVIVYWDDQDGIFVAEVPELPGCMAHGETKAAAIQNAEDAIALWVRTAQEDGMAVPEPKGKLMYA